MSTKNVSAMHTDSPVKPDEADKPDGLDSWYRDETMQAATGPVVLEVPAGNRATSLNKTESKDGKKNGGDQPKTSNGTSNGTGGQSTQKGTENSKAGKGGGNKGGKADKNSSGSEDVATRKASNDSKKIVRDTLPPRRL